MGYMTRLDLIEVAIKPRCVAMVDNALRGKNKRTLAFQWVLDRLEIDPDGFLQWDWRKDPYGPSAKFHNCDEAFVNWLRKYCAGGVVALRSEEGDGAAWAYEFDGKGGVSSCNPRRASAIMGWAGRKNPERDVRRYDRIVENQKLGFAEHRQ